MKWPEHYAFCICDFETTGVDTEKDFPIEIGCIFTDHKFVFLGSIRSFIHWPEVEERIVKGERGEFDWPPEWKPGFRVHGIETKDLTYARPAGEVAQGIINIIDELRSTSVRRVILLSDNAQFEYRFMQRLFEGHKWPFHYCAWDSSILLVGSGVGDPIPAHRALPDAALLHQALIRAWERVGFFEED